ncbi:MAG: hypothetical protein NVS2B16_02340 [Chloroflexota bacterium]
MTATTRRRQPTIAPAAIGVAPSKRWSDRLDPEKTFAGVVIVTAFLACVLWGAILPFNAAPDEESHYNMDWYVAVHDQLPIFDRSAQIYHTTCAPNGPCYASYASVPPGGPLLAAALMKVEHGITGTPYEPFSVVNTGGQGTVDTLREAARGASALCVLMYVLFLYLTSRLLFSQPMVRMTAVVIGAFIPQVTFVGAYTNDDSIGMAAGTAVLYLSLRMLRDGLQWRTALATGLALGTLALAKLDYYMLFVAFAACAALRVRAEVQDRRVRAYVARLLAAAGVAALLSRWWFVRGWMLYRDPFGLAVWRRHINAAAPGYSAHTPAGQGSTIFSMLRDTPWAQFSFDSAWATFDYMSLWFSPWVYKAIHGGVALCIGGALYAVADYLTTHHGLPARDRWRAQAWVILVSLVMIVVMQSLYHSLTDAYNPQGRYLFPALAPAVLFLAAGAQGWSSKWWGRTPAFAVVGAGMLCLNIGALVFTIAPAYHYW